MLCYRICYITVWYYVNFEIYSRNVLMKLGKKERSRHFFKYSGNNIKSAIFRTTGRRHFPWNIILFESKMPNITTREYYR